MNELIEVGRLAKHKGLAGRPMVGKVNLAKWQLWRFDLPVCSLQVDFALCVQFVGNTSMAVVPLHANTSWFQPAGACLPAYMRAGSRLLACAVQRTGLE